MAAENNFGHFTGVGREFWRAKAQGLQPKLVRGRSGTRLTFTPDPSDGFAMNNGGILAPQETKILPGRWYRFYATIDHNKHGPDAFTGGNWWLDYENFRKIEAWSEEHGLSLARAAQQLIVIPSEWSDCGYLGIATLSTALKAWVGKGKPATGQMSPASAARGSALSGGAYVPLVASPEHLEIKQYFVPGERPLLSRLFQFKERRRAF